MAEALAAGVLAVAGVDATAQTWHFEPSVAGEVTLTDNVTLAPSAARKGDLITTITPGLRFSEKGAHSSLVGDIRLPVQLYARTSENNEVQPEASINGMLELYPRLFFIDGAVQVSQQYFSPFGARPQNLATATNNRYTAQLYRISPFIKGEAGNGLTYELRNNNTWTSGNGAPATTDRGYTNEIVGHVSAPPQPLGWTLEYDRTDTRFTTQDPFLTEISRGRALWRPDPQWELSATAGYEDNRYPFSDFAGATYGVGVRWHPSERTTVETWWEHRFFGGSYLVAFDHRTPLSVWSVRTSRNVTSYPQQLANFAGGGDVNVLLNTLFGSRITDPVARQTFIDQLIRERGLPPLVSGPLALFSQQITLEQLVEASMTLLGVRNSIFVRVFTLRSEPIGGEAARQFADLLSTQLDNTQSGVTAVWTYRLTPLYTLSTTGGWARTVANDESGQRSTQGTLQVVLSAPLSLLTKAYAGVRLQRLTSNIADQAHEAAAFVGISHTFR